MWWSMPAAASWTFAELSGSFKERSGFHDTGHTFRAFLPFEEEPQRSKLRQFRGPVPVMDHRVICASLPLVNLTLDATQMSYVHLSGQIPIQDLTYPLLLNKEPLPYINFTCKLPVPRVLENSTVGETSLCNPNIRRREPLNWAVLNEDPLVQPDGFPEASTLFLVLDVLSAAAVIHTANQKPAVQTIRTDGPWTIISNGSSFSHIETLRISACVTNLAVQNLAVGMSSPSDNPEPKTAWDHHTQRYNTEPSRRQLGALAPDKTDNAVKSGTQRGILTLDPRS